MTTRKTSIDDTWHWEESSKYYSRQKQPEWGAKFEPDKPAANNGLKIYLAGPIAKTNLETTKNKFAGRKTALQALGFTVINPMEHHDPFELNNTLVSRDFWWVDRCDILVADITGCTQSASIGTCMEIARAYTVGKHIVLLRDPFISADADKDAYYHPFIWQCCHKICINPTEMIDYLKGLVQ